MAALYVSSKMHDTLKKPRDLLMVSYAVRFPELDAKVKHGGGEVDMDPNVSSYLILKYYEITDKVGTDCRSRSAETACGRATGVGDDMLQLPCTHAFFVCDQSRARASR